MAPAQNFKLTTCFSTIKLGGVKPLLYSIALSSALVSSSFANTTTPEISAEYLNQLTSPKVTWEAADATGNDIIEINGNYYKYTYHKPDDYTETNTRLNNNLNETNTQSVVFKDIVSTSDGGAIYNYSEFNNQINADFIGNYAPENTYSYGGAISNEGILGDIIGDFIGNYAKFGSYEAHGGAIENIGTIGDITGNFVSNYVVGKNKAHGGAIYNITGNIGNIAGNFIGNYTEATNNYSFGGAIYNETSIGNITGDFIENYAESANSNTRGGAIDNSGTIGDITGNFINNHTTSYDSSQSGAISNSQGTIGDITGNFIGNYTESTRGKAFGGAIYNYQGLISNIHANFTDNYSSSFSTSSSNGGAINNNTNAIINNIKGKFTNNYALGKLGKAVGGAILNLGRIDNIEGEFFDNYVLSEENLAYGGAISSNGTITLTNSSFYNNYAKIETTNKSNVYGGAIFNKGTLNISANDGKQSIFSGNKIIYKDNTGNDIEESNAIHTVNGTLNLSTIDNGQIIFDDSISGNNYTINITGDESSQVVFNETVEALSTNISGTNVFANKGLFPNAFIHDGGVLNLGADVTLEDSTVTTGGTLNISSEALGNRILVDDGGVLHIASRGLANDISINSGGSLKAQVAAKINNLLANEGAKLNIDKDAIMTGNIIINAKAEMGGTYDYSKIFKSEATEQGSLTLVGGFSSAMNQDSLINEVANKKLNLTSGDYIVGSQNSSVKGWDKLTVADAKVKLAGNIEMANPSKSINIASDGILDLAGNSPLIATISGSVNNDGVLDFHHDNDGADDITNIYGNYIAFNNARMSVDFDISANSGKGQADQLLVDGDVSGKTLVTFYPLTDGQTVDLIKFVDAPNDDASTGARFEIERVWRQAVDTRDQWKIVHKDNAWFITSVTTDTTGLTDGYGDTDNGDLDIDLAGDAVLPSNFPNTPTIVPTTPSPSDKPTVDATTKAYAETIAYMALPTVGLEQVRDLTKVVTNKVASTKYKCADCGVYDHMYNGRPLNNAWVDMSHRKADLEAPADVEAKINAVDLGFDVQSDPYNRLGVFASYRQGDYELSGEGQDYYSTEGSELDIDSWALGLYHRYDRRRLWTMSSIYGGLQQVDLTTNDGVSADTDGLMFGANIEAGVVFEPQKRLTLEPSIRLGYNFIKYDDMSDRYGKTAEYDNISNLEAELGVKIEKSWIFGRRGIAKLFVKPSVIQNMGKGDVSITSLDAVEGIDNQTLLRGEIGMSIAGDNGLSGFATVGHTFGSDYKSTDFNAGLGYSW